MTKFFKYLILPLFILGIFSCNKEWTEEQFDHLISFKAPLDALGVTNVFLPYDTSGPILYELPLIVSGSTDNSEDIDVEFGLDLDTLSILNSERFQNREDLYYLELPPSYYSIPDRQKIKGGENTALVNVEFNLKGLDMVHKWMLPLTIVKGKADNYKINTRKDYDKALLRIIPFNDFSGDYGATSLKVFLRGSSDGSAIVQNTKTAYVVDEATIFFYAGLVDEDNIDRENYKIEAHFDTTTRRMDISVDNPTMNFQLNSDPTFSVEEIMDDVRPYLLHRFVTISNLDYDFTDYTTSPGSPIDYNVSGSITLERKINTQIPDRDQAIEW